MRLSALIPLAIALAAPAAAAPNLYLTAKIDTFLDGKADEASRAGGLVLEGLTKAGYRVVDPAGLEGLADNLKAGKLEGKYPQVDWILAITIETDELAAGVMDSGFVRYEAAAEARVLAADTGEVVGVVRTKGQGMDLSKRTSARMAAEQASKKLAAALEAKTDALLSKATRLRLEMTGVPDAAEAGRIAERLKRLEGVEDATVRSFADQAANVDLRVAQMSTGQLAQRIEAARGLGLGVDRYTTRQLAARYAPERRVRISMLVAPFENGTGDPIEGWLSTEIPKVVQLVLSNHPALTVNLGALGPHPKKLAEVPAHLVAHGADAEPLLYVTGRYDFAGGDKGELQVKVFRVLDGKVLAQVTTSGDLAAFRSTIVEAARGLGPDTVAAVVKHDELRQVAGIGKGERTALAKLEASPRHLEAVQVQPILTGDTLKGTVTLKAGATPLEGLSLRVRGAKGALAVEAPTVKAGGEVQVPLALPLKDLGVTEPGSNRVEVELSWRDASGWRSERVITPVVVFPEATALAK